MSRPHEPVHFHVDMDAFYASVEQADKPELRDKPVIIGAAPGKRGVVSACSYEARAFGVHSAMPISEAYRRCPEGIYLPVRMDRYKELSAMIMALFSRYTPEIKQISVDEAFLNMTGTERLLGTPEEVAARIKQDVKTCTDLTISVGIAPNRFLAKLASEVDKPDGLYRVERGKEIEFLDSLELRKLWGLGKKTLARLKELNIQSIPMLRSIDEASLKRLMGEHSGSFLYQACRGIDPGIFSEEVKNRSISNETTFRKDTRDRETIDKTLLELSDQVFFRMISAGESGRTVFVKMRFSDFRTSTIQNSLDRTVGSAEELYSICKNLLAQRWNGSEELRLLGLGISGLSRKTAVQNELFEDQWGRKKQVDKAILEIRQRGNAIMKASLLKNGTAQPDDQENR